MQEDEAVTSERSNRCDAVVAGVATLLLACGVAAGQDAGPQVVNPRQQYESFFLDEFDAAIRLEWRLDIDELDPEGAPSQRDTENRFREILELGTTGYIGHPNLIQLDLYTELWLTQRQLDLDFGDDERSNELLFQYDVSALILRESALPVTIYGRQTISDIDRQFGSSLQSTVTEYGIRADLRNERLPTHVELFRLEQDQDDSFGGNDFRIEQNSARADGNVVFNDHSVLNWDVSYDDVSESGDVTVPQDFERLQASAQHTLEFDRDYSSQLRSIFRYYGESGDRDFDQFRVLERLQTRFSPDLLTRLEGSYIHVDRNDFEQQRYDLTGILQHQLFDSLSTVGRAGYIGQEIPTDDYDSDEIFADISMDYTKRAPLGRIDAGFDGAVSRLNESEFGATVDVIDRPFVFDASGLIVITQRNVDPNSIRVTDATGLFLYAEGADYTVLATETRVEIRRVLGGNIPPESAVLISYSILPQPGGTTTTTGLGGEFRYTFEETFATGLSLYTRVFTQNEDRNLDRMTADDIIDNDFTDFTYGLEYTRAGFYLKAERMERDSELDPFYSTRLEGRYLLRYDVGSSFILNALYQDIDRTDDDIQTSTFTISGTLNHRFTRNFRARASALWQYEDTNFGGDAQGFEQTVELLWEYGRTEFVFRFENSINDNETDDTMFQTFFVGIRREF